MPKTAANRHPFPVRRWRVSALTTAKPWLLLLFLLLNQLNIATHAQEHDAQHATDCQVCVQLFANGHAPATAYVLPTFAPAIAEVIVSAGLTGILNPVYLTPVPRAPPLISLL
jgi:hypothetical protein